MELPQLGDRCQRTDCQRLDFLPVVCPRCSVRFCSDHFPLEKHDCTGAALVSEATPELKPVKDFVTCTLCIERSAVENVCLICKKHFCIIHRHHGCDDRTKEELDREREKWNAPKRQFEAAKQRADAIVEAKLQKAANPTALKVQRMRLKQRAEGQASVPTTDRAYFSVDGAALFVSRHAPLGILLDHAVTKLRLPAAATLAGDDGPLPNDQSVQALIDSGRIAEGQALTLAPVQDFVTCTLCTEQIAVENLCVICKKHFCIIHRHHGCDDRSKEELNREGEKCNAPKSQLEATEKRADAIVEAKSVKAANPTALKVQFMRLKQRAEGPASVPTTDRAYFSVDGAALFVSRRAPLGRLLDQAVAKLRVPAAAALAGDDGPLPNDQSVQALIDSRRIAEGQALTLARNS